MSDRARVLVCILLLTMLVVVLFADVLFLGRGLFLLDLSRYHYPMKRIVRDTILSGEFPWWNRFYSGGQPMAANPAYEIFYPGQWPVLLGSYRFGYNLHIILHLWLALVGAFLFLREDGRGYTASAIGALSFATSGYFYGLLTILPTCFVWAWTPLAAFFLWRWRKRGEVRWLACAALTLGMQVLVGEPVSLIQNWILLGVCAIADAATVSPGERRRILWKNGAALALLAVLSAGVAAVQLLPGSDHLRDTSRGGGLPYRVVVGFSSAPERPLELLYPRHFGSHRDSGPYYWGVSKFHGTPYLLSIYLGLIVAIGAMASPFARPREGLPVLLLCAIAYAAALGNHTPFFDALYDLGIASRFRYPEKFLSLIVLPLIWLAARTIDRFMLGDHRTRIAVLASSTVVAAGTGVVTLWSQSLAYRRWFVDHWLLVERPETQPLVELSRHYWLIATALTVVLALLLWTRPLWRTELWSAMLVGFCLLDLSQIHGDLAPRMPRQFFQPPGIVAALDRPLSEFSIFFEGNWLLAYFYPKFDQAGYGRYWIDRNGLLPPTQGSWGVRSAMNRDYDETYLAPTRDMIAAMLSLNLKGIAAWWQPFAAISNVRYVLDYRDFDQVARECRGHFESSRPVTLRRFAVASPRYYLATELIQAPHWRDVAAVARRRGVIPEVAFVSSAPFVPARGRIMNVTERPSEARIEVESSGRSFLVATVTRHRYWHVEVDGRRTDPQPANIAYQGVVIPPGRHVVTMRYRNPLVVAGGVISAFAIAVIIVGIVLGGRWKIGADS